MGLVCIIWVCILWPVVIAVIYFLDDSKKNHEHPINFYVFCEIYEQEAEHADSLKHYHKEGKANADYQQWVLLEDVKE